MEGLVFTIYKALKKNKAPKQSEYSSDEATQRSNNNKNDDIKNKKTKCSYNISDFYPDGYNYHYIATSPQATNFVEESNELSNGTRGQLKRQNTVKGFNYYSSSNTSSVTTTSTTLEDDDDAIALKPMRRNWSRRLFPSCISGI